MNASLAGRRILVVEDEYMLAECLHDLLRGDGAEVLGPASCVEDANALLDRHPLPDAAVLDINLGRQSVYPVADRLSGQGVPFLFTTGYDHGLIPERYSDCLQCVKPFGVDDVRALLLELLHADAR
ncbi:response regulator [Stenotrophomonas nitritireducens]|uniref:response regulator n=1 Tax=Stenotrophomonas nitritireducens TaxID=83617 RepID=UPI003D99EB5B